MTTYSHEWIEHYGMPDRELEPKEEPDELDFDDLRFEESEEENE